MTPITAFTIVDMLSLLVYIIITAILIFAVVFATVAIIGLIRGISNVRDNNRRARHRPTPADLPEDEKKYY